MKPLANFLALREPHLEVRRALRARLVSDGYASVGEFGTWLLAERPLRSRADVGAPPLGEQRRIAFAEGRELAVLKASSAADWRVVSERLGETGRDLNLWIGDFTFAHLTPGGTLAVARSVSGRVPVYVNDSPKRTVVATQLGAVARYSSSEPRIDPWAAALHMEALMQDERQSVLAGTCTVPPGYWASAATGFRLQRYWDPRSIVAERPSRRRVAEHAERLSAAVREAVASEFDDNSLLTLSGGLDSSCLAGLASRAGKRYTTLTFLPPDPRQRAVEQGWLRRVRRHIRSSVRNEEDIVLTPQGRLSVLESAPRTVIPYRHPALAMLPRLCERYGITTFVGGEGADELFGGLTIHEHWMHALRPLDLVHLPSSIPFVARHALRYARFLRGWARGLPLLPVPTELSTFFHESLCERYVVWRRDVGTRYFRSSAARPLLELRHQMFANAMAMHWEVCSRLGVARAFPFVNRAGLELALEAHPVEGLGWGAKRLARIGFRDSVPAGLRARRDKGDVRPIAQTNVAWSSPVPGELLGALRATQNHSRPEILGVREALRLRALVNIVEALRIERDRNEHA